MIKYDDSASGTLMVVTFFTNHANAFVFISSLLFLSKLNNKHIDRFAFITLVDITITCVVFFTMLLPFMDNISFVKILLHGIIPPLYILFYFFAYPRSIPLKEAWISLLHPMFYFLFVFLFLHLLYAL